MKKLVCCLTAALLMLGTAACAAPQTAEVPQPTPEAIAVETGTLDANAAPTAAAATTDQVIDFGDDVLEALVREAMNRPTGDITVADAEAVTDLDMQQQGVDPNQPYIHNLDALKYFKNLTYLGLGYAVQNADDPNAPIDISSFAGMTKLESLQLGGLVVDDLSVVANMPNLMSLTVFGGKRLTDISALANETNLEALTLRGNLISDITPLVGLTKLRYIDLQDNQISDVTPLAGLTKLERLFLEQNPITDYSPLAQIRANLEEWDFEVPANP
ncbi:MAG: leucine-rich repeat domain-containing protein [Christensenella sp.]|nr:leucine-rich repeat domain-containing protein [Christensenella sp.]